MIRGDQTPYYAARLRAAEYDEKLGVRRLAANALHISEDTLKGYELGYSRTPNDVVIRMADLYNVPELPHKYCARDCPIGQRRGTGGVDISAPLERAALHVGLCTRGSDGLAQDMADIAADGRITREELPKAWELIAQLERQKQVMESAAVMLRMACVAAEREKPS
jgi:predicted metal-dependent phosphoesterase TrpH